MSANEDEARAQAEMFLADGSNGFRFEHLSTKLVEGEWSVVFAVISPSGHELDGPVVVIVNPASGEPRAL